MSYSERKQEVQVPMQKEDTMLPVTDALKSSRGIPGSKNVPGNVGSKIYYWFRVNSFSPGFLASPWSHPAWGYLAAFLLQAATVSGILLLLQVYPGVRFPEALMLLVVLMISLFWGAGPGLVTTLVGTLFLVVLLLPPYFSLAFAHRGDAFGTVLFLCVGLIICLVASQLERARAEAVLQRRRVERLYIQLENEQRALRATEQETRTRASELEAIFEGLTDGIALFDTEGHAVHTNTAMHELLMPYTSAAFPTLDLATDGRLLQLKPTNEHGELITRETSPVRRILSGEVLTGLNSPIISLQSEEGQSRLLLIGGAPVRASDGTIMGAVAIIRDVTKRRQADRRTQEALEALLVMAEELVRFPEETIQQADQATKSDAVTQRLAELIASVLACKRVSITTIDPETGQHRSAAVVGLTPELEWRWRERRPGYLLSEQLNNPSIDARLHSDEVLVLDLSKPPFNKRPNPYGIHTMLLAPMIVGMRMVGVVAIDHGGTVRGQGERKEWVYTPGELALTKAVAKLAALVVERERLLTERAESQARELALRDANRLMDEFIAIAGHEIRTPLTTIKGSVQLARRQLNKAMRRDAALPSDVKKLITSVQDLIDRAERQIGMQNRLVSDLLDVARIRSNRLELHPELCDLTTIVRETTEDQQYLSPTRTIQCDIQAQGEVLVMADADRLQQVIGNYLSNALKYSETRQPVTVCLDHDQTKVRVRVRDNGPGLPLTEQQRIWERFYRVEGIEAKTGSGVGLGLGLHICRMIIERQGGQVGVESSPGHGSTFWFTLPLAETIEMPPGDI